VWKLLILLYLTYRAMQALQFSRRGSRGRDLPGITTYEPIETMRTRATVRESLSQHRPESHRWTLLCRENPKRFRRESFQGDSRQELLHQDILGLRVRPSSYVSGSVCSAYMRCTREGLLREMTFEVLLSKRGTQWAGTRMNVAAWARARSRLLHSRVGSL
jgi:hypothetical protein